MNRAPTLPAGLLASLMTGLALLVPASSLAQPAGPDSRSTDAATSHAVPLSEFQHERTGLRETLRSAVPAEPPTFTDRIGAAPAGKPVNTEAEPFSVPGAKAPGARSSGRELFATTSQARDPYWPLNALDYPNRMVGLLVYRNRGSYTCSATVTSGAAGYAVLTTAGHCVYDIDSNTWSHGMRFCPGYRAGCRLGWWKARWMSTTNTWVNGETDTGVNVWDRSVDDFAVVTVRPHRGGGIGRVTGYQGIDFNQPTGIYRLALGYPAPDRRSPYYYDGKRLAYCLGVDSFYRGEVSFPCTMTGGSSGGPWLEDWDEDYIGYVNSVNSTGPNTRMVGPYFDNEERRAWKAGSRH